MKVMVRWRDDRAQGWQDELTQELAGKLDFLYFHTPGIYRTRQYEFSVTDAVPFVLIAAEEELEGLRV